MLSGRVARISRKHVLEDREFLAQARVVFLQAANLLCKLGLRGAFDSELRIQALAIARSRPSSASLPAISRLSSVSSMSASLRSKPAKAPPRVVHPRRERTDRAQNSTTPSQRQYHARWVRTVMFGAAMPRRRRSLRSSLLATRHLQGTSGT